MTLTAFIMLALCAFYHAAQESELPASWATCAILYGALGAATLTKGLVGVIVPGMDHCLLRPAYQQLENLGKDTLAFRRGAFLLIVVPWYILAETQNPGYLRYYIWDEHFGRFATTKFDRFSPWYFYLYIVPLGLLPWTFLLPATVSFYWRRRLDDRTLWLILWALLPIMFFSMSKSKLAHYILPSFPPLAILLGVAVSRILSDSRERLRYGLARAGWF